MEKAKVTAELIKIEDLIGYRIKINSEAATVQDYMDAINNFISQNGYHRTRNEVINDCEGCRFCCNERIPLTNIDIVNIKKHELIEDDDLKEIIKNYGFVYLDGPVVDIYLARNSRKNCNFLDEKSYRCRIYTNRPLVCQTFICCPADEDSKKLRESIVNLGEDQLVRDWLISHSNGEMMHIDDADEPEISLADWKNNIFHQKENYNEIFIKDIINKELWTRLYNG